jgi:thiol:disulfide interchange protein
MTKRGTWIALGVAAVVATGVSLRPSPEDDGFFQPYDEAALRAAREAGRPVLIETYADW